MVRDTCLFLEGRHDSIAKRIGSAMDEASESLEFERAAKLRDQLLSIRKLTEKQKMINTDEVDQDIVSLLSENGSTFVQLLFIRSGRLIGQKQFFLEGVVAEEDSPETSLSEFLKQYYRDAAYVPKEILVSHKPEEWTVLEDWLTLKRGNRVDIHHPQRGEKRRLIEMAHENAQILAAQQHDEESRNQDNLLDLAEAIGMEELPNRIEAYDISNLQGTETVASMVVFEGGVPAKAEYRRFKIRTVDGPNDYASMKEAIRRRFTASADNPKFAKLPDLVVIDGGKGQLSAALEGLDEAIGRAADGESRGETIRTNHESRIMFISLAKQFEQVFLPGQSDPILLPRNAPALRLLQRIRDEAHRFALSYHHKLRSKTATKSVLDSIPGIGNERRKALIKKFGSLAGVKAASLEDLIAASGMNRKTAEAVYEALHGESD